MNLADQKELKIKVAVERIKNEEGMLREVREKIVKAENLVGVWRGAWPRFRGKTVAEEARQEKGQQETFAHIDFHKKNEYINSLVIDAFNRKKEEYEQPIQQPSMDYLVNQSYAEQLQKRLKENMHNRLMSDTFM